MSLSLRVFLGITLVVTLAGLLLFSSFKGQIHPLLQQATEDTLVDTANVLAPVAEADLAGGHIGDGYLAQAVQSLHHRALNAHIWSHTKQLSDLQVYVTDTHGLLLYDSAGAATGQDYSRWNDVYLTLHGHYGSRASRANMADPTSSVLHVAAPLMRDGRLVGVISVSKPVLSLQAFVALAEGKLAQNILLVLLVALLVALLFSWWISLRLRQRVNYADAVSAKRRVSLPPMPAGELKALGLAMESMRTELEGKAYIEHYVQALTHEIKSPLAAIRASAELLEDELPPVVRARFLGNIQQENARAQDLIERLLELARLEQRQTLQEAQLLDIGALWQQVLRAADSRLQQKNLRVLSSIPESLQLRAEGFLLQQALRNLLDNAIAFSPEQSELHFQAQALSGQISLSLRDHGPGIPDYAELRIFERFYSLPRADGSRGSGLGLPFVREIASLHGGSISLRNHPEGGVDAMLTLPV